MKVQRIVANIHADDISAAKIFYRDVLGLDVLMDHGWLATYGSDERMTVQVGIASQGGSDTPTLTSPLRSTTSRKPSNGSRLSEFPSSTARPTNPGVSAGSTCATRSAS